MECIGYYGIFSLAQNMQELMNAIRTEYSEPSKFSPNFLFKIYSALNLVLNDFQLKLL